MDPDYTFQLESRALDHKSNGFYFSIILTIMDSRSSSSAPLQKIIFSP